ncbi:MAG: HEAT repeat domain-containing protein [Myxococcus sp.]|nr:HEAT repeat domain-containing protein [Myxococcus sp.]
MLRRGFLLGLLLVSGHALAKDKRAEFREALAGLTAGTLSATHAANRISFAGMEVEATEALAFELRRLIDPRVRNAYFEVLAQIATPHADVLRLATDAARSTDDLTFRLNGLRILGRLKQPSSVPVLTPMLTDKLLGVRRESAKALIAIKSPKAARELLVAAKTEDDPETRALMVIGVGRLGDAKLSKGLESLLESSSESTRLAATQALCLLGSKKGMEAARVLLASTDKFERLQGVMLFEGAPAKLAGPLLTPLLGDPEKSVRARAARLLAQGGDGRLTEWLVLESFKAPVEERLLYEGELELLRLPDEQRAIILRKAGLK